MGARSIRHAEAPPRVLCLHERAAFDRDGFLVRPRAFAPGELAALLEAFERLEARGRRLERTCALDGATFAIAPTGPEGAARLQRVVWCGAAEAELERVGADPRVLLPALELLGEPAADQLVNQAHFKAPGDGVGFPLHQDAWNRRWGTALWRDRSPDGGYIQVVLTLDPMDTDTGPLCVIPGSHREGPIVGPRRRERVEALARARPPRPVLAPAGSLVVFGPFLVHGSAVNRGPRPRRLLVNGYARVGVNRRRYPGAGLGVRRGREASAPSRQESP